MTFWIMDEDVAKFTMFSPINHDCHGLNLFLQERKWGQELRNSWQPLPVKRRKNRYTGDFFALDGCLHFVVNEKALHHLLPLIGGDVEYLPVIDIDNPTMKLYVINILEISDCLDHEQSNIEYFDDGKRVMMIRVPIIFKPNCIGNTHIFRLKDVPALRIFVSDAFKKIVEENKLSGLEFYSLIIKDG